MNYGFVQSRIDGTELVFDDISKNSSIEIPSSYSYEKYMNKLYNQGAKPICVPCSIASFIDWENDLNKLKFTPSVDYIFDQREDKKAEGMSIKEALSFIKKNGYISENDYKKLKNNDELSITKNKISSYAKLGSPFFMQRSIFINGPFLMGLPVMDSSRIDFWNGSKFEGGHCVLCVGYDENSLRIKNSWGSSYGENGYASFPINDIGKIYEAWAIIK